MAEDKLSLPEEYDPDAPPLPYDQQAEVRGREARTLLSGLRRLRWIGMRRDALDSERKALQRKLLPLMTRPVALLDPVTGDPVIANAQQARPIKVDAGELLDELVRYYKGLWPTAHEDAAAHAEMIWEQTLKPREVDTKDDGAFKAVCLAHRDDRPTIPPEVIAKVAREKPAEAFIQFPKMKSR